MKRKLMNEKRLLQGKFLCILIPLYWGGGGREKKTKRPYIWKETFTSRVHMQSDTLRIKRHGKREKTERSYAWKETSLSMKRDLYKFPYNVSVQMHSSSLCILIRYTYIEGKKRSRPYLWRGTLCMKRDLYKASSRLCRGLVQYMHSPTLNLWRHLWRHAFSHPEPYALHTGIVTTLKRGGGWREKDYSESIRAKKRKREYERDKNERRRGRG